MMQCQYCRGQLFPQRELGERPYLQCLQCSRVVYSRDEEPLTVELRCEICQDGPYYNPAALTAHQRRCGSSRKDRTLEYIELARE